MLTGYFNDVGELLLAGNRYLGLYLESGSGKVEMDVSVVIADE